MQSCTVGSNPTLSAIDLTARRQSVYRYALPSCIKEFLLTKSKRVVRDQRTVTTQSWNRQGKSHEGTERFVGVWTE